MNGMYHPPASECLGEVLLETEGAGALAFWGSTTLAEPIGQEETFREVVRILFQEGGRTIGEAFDEAEVRTWGDGFDRNDLVQSWVLLGDPATRLR